MTNISEEEKKAQISEAVRLFSECSSLFSCLGDSTRQGLIFEIAKTGIEGLDVASLTATTSLSRPAVSHHLKVLKDSGLICSFKRGTQVFYRLKLENKIKPLKNLILLVEKIIYESYGLKE